MSLQLCSAALIIWICFASPNPFRSSSASSVRPSVSLLFWETDIDFRTFSQFSSVAQSCPTLCNPLNCSTPGLPVYHQLLESTQTYVHRISDVIWPSHPLSSPSPPVPNPSQNQGLFQ